jgi:recombination protein RecT
MSNLKRFNSSIININTQTYLEQVLGEKKSSFINNITALVSNDAKLQVCEPMSLIYAGIKATALDLPLDSNLGFAYVIPYKNKKKVTEINPKTNLPVTREIEISEAQFQMGYRGFKQLAIRTGQFKTIHCSDIREGELKTRNRLTGEISFDFMQDDKERMKKDIIGFVSYFELSNGFSSTFYMSTDELKAHGLRYSKTYGNQYESTRNSSKWTTDFEAMCLKTVTKLNLSKNAPLSVEMQHAVIADQAVIEEHGQRYVDNDSAPRQTIEEAEVIEQGEPETAAEAETPQPKKINLNDL